MQPAERGQPHVGVREDGKGVGGGVCFVQLAAGVEAVAMKCNPQNVANLMWVNAKMGGRRCARICCRARVCEREEKHRKGRIAATII